MDFVEKFAAAGKIPGGFFKREGRLSDREVLVSRFIDRSIRPLFADGYNDETQVTATVLSADPRLLGRHLRLRRRLGGALDLGAFPSSGRSVPCASVGSTASSSINPTPEQLEGAISS